MKVGGVILLLFFQFALLASPPDLVEKRANGDFFDSIAALIYKDLNFPDLSQDAFHQAFRGYSILKCADTTFQTDLITLIDFDKPSTSQRLFVINIKNREIVHRSLVAHGKNTGGNLAKSFSNRPNSNQSSLGLYLTAETYYGKHGLSLRLDGLEPGVNDKARERNIVIHSADYVSRSFINRVGRLGRSFGCPALPKKDYKKVLDMFENKSLLFIYSSKRESADFPPILNSAL